MSETETERGGRKRWEGEIKKIREKQKMLLGGGGGGKSTANSVSSCSP